MKSNHFEINKPPITPIKTITIAISIATMGVLGLLELLTTFKVINPPKNLKNKNSFSIGKEDWQ
jgi:hypothetical protein